jgi:hypothetical protein
MIASDDGAQLAVLDTGHIRIINARSLQPCAEIGIEGGTERNDIAFAGNRLIVMTRYGKRSTLYMIDTRDPRGPQKLGELVWRSGARMLAATAHHVLMLTQSSIMLVNLDPIEIAVLPVRDAIGAASRLGNDRFIIASECAIEEWDAVDRKPTRRLELEGKLDPQFVGGNALRLWMIRRSEPDQIDVVSFTRNAPRRYTLAEPVKCLDVHARGDLLVAIGAETGMPFVIDLAQAEPVLRIGLPSVERATWLGRGRRIAFAPLGGALGVHHVPGSTESDADLTPEPETPNAPRDNLSARLAAWRAKQPGPRAVRNVRPANHKLA